MPAAIDTTRRTPKQVLMVVANPGTSELTGWPIGFWASEFIHPWYAFSEAGYEVTIASPDGGRVQIDFLSDPDDRIGYSREDVLSSGFLASDALTVMWKPSAVRDGRLITGQQQFSAKKVAELVIAAVGT